MMKKNLVKVFPAVLILTLSTVFFTGCTRVAVPGGDSNQSIKAETTAGGYTEQRELTQEDKDLFDEVMKDIDDEKTYEPVSVATQVVAGTNYRFLVNVTEDGKESQTYIVIYQPLPGQGDAELTDLKVGMLME